MKILPRTTEKVDLVMTHAERAEVTAALRDLGASPGSVLRELLDVLQASSGGEASVSEHQGWGKASTTCSRCGRIIRLIPAGRSYRWVNLGGTGWRCRPTATDPNQSHDPVLEKENA